MSLSSIVEPDFASGIEVSSSDAILVAGRRADPEFAVDG